MKTVKVIEGPFEVVSAGGYTLTTEIESGALLGNVISVYGTDETGNRQHMVSLYATDALNFAELLKQSAGAV